MLRVLVVGWVCTAGEEMISGNWTLCRYCMALPHVEGRGDDLWIKRVTIYSIISIGQWTFFVPLVGRWAVFGRGG